MVGFSMIVDWEWEIDWQIPAINHCLGKFVNRNRRGFVCRHLCAYICTICNFFEVFFLINTYKYIKNQTKSVKSMLDDHTYHKREK